MIITKEQVLSWHERLSFVKNEVQTELDCTVPGTDRREKALEEVNTAIQNAKAKVEAFAKASGLQLFPKTSTK